MLSMRNILAFPGARRPHQPAEARNWARVRQLNDPYADFHIEQPVLPGAPGIDTLFIQPPHVQPSRRTLVYSNGNAGQLPMSWDLLFEMARVCEANVFAYAYPGYGASEGAPSEQTCREALKAVVQYLTQLEVECIVLVGRSLGSGPTVDIAAECGNTEHGHAIATSGLSNIKGVVLWCGISSGLQAFFGLCWAEVWKRIDIFRNIDKASKVNVPVFIIHAVNDSIVSVQAAIAMHGKCGKSVAPYLPLSGTHNDINTKASFAGIKSFADLVENAPDLSDDERWRRETQPRDASKAVDPHSLPIPSLENLHELYRPHPHALDKMWALFALFMLSLFFSLDAVWIGRAGVVLCVMVGVGTFLWSATPNCPIPPIICAAWAASGSIPGALFCLWPYANKSLRDASAMMGRLAACWFLLLLVVAAVSEYMNMKMWKKQLQARRFEISAMQDPGAIQPLLSPLMP